MQQTVNTLYPFDKILETEVRHRPIGRGAAGKAVSSSVPIGRPCYVQINSLVAQQGSSTSSRAASATCIRLHLEQRSALITAAFLHPLLFLLLICPRLPSSLCLLYILCILHRPDPPICQPTQGCGTAFSARSQADNPQLRALLIAGNLLLVQQQLFGAIRGVFVD